MEFDLRDSDVGGTPATPPSIRYAPAACADAALEQEKKKADLEAPAAGGKSQAWL